MISSIHLIWYILKYNTDQVHVYYCRHIIICGVPIFTVFVGLPNNELKFPMKWKFSTQLCVTSINLKKFFHSIVLSNNKERKSSEETLYMSNVCHQIVFVLPLYTKHKSAHIVMLCSYCTATKIAYKVSPICIYMYKAIYYSWNQSIHLGSR